MAVVKVGKGKWENIGKKGLRHGVLHSKKAAEKQKAAIFANDPKLAKERANDCPGEDKMHGHKDVGEDMRKHDHHADERAKKHEQA
jgi:hypothetical protein